MTHSRLKIAADGSLELPVELREALGWKTGGYLEATVEGESLKLRAVEVDLFAEALKAPDPDSFEKILERQKKSREEAFKAFEEKVKRGDGPEVRPEDKPDFWR
ncbi:MAG: AbrB/MazE/SpoVT family DNA-binding domain-containing protein [Planctomycetes bacterium]|nr:AbrB/MazE/SpoVT family DNA-binding domain-containing protein [Planctomycetota bacterium]